MADGVGANAVRAAGRGLESPSVSTGWARPAGIMKTLEARMTWPRRIGGAMAFAPGYEDAAYVGKPGPGSINLDQRLQPVAAMAAARLAVECEHPGCGVQAAQPDRTRIAPSLSERPFAARPGRRLFHGNAPRDQASGRYPPPCTRTKLNETAGLGSAPGAVSPCNTTFRRPPGGPRGARPCRELCGPRGARPTSETKEECLTHSASGTDIKLI